VAGAECGELLSECLHLEVFASSDERRLALAWFIGYYIDVRPHLGIGGRTPRQRLELKLAA
jgi:transposase InsO family protein